MSATSNDNLSKRLPLGPSLAATPTALNYDGGSNRSRTPGSISHSAVKDGKNLLATFRQNKRRNYSSSIPATATGVRPRQIIGSTGGAASTGASSSPEERTVSYLEMYKSRAPGLARNLEAALDASLANRKNAVAANDDGDDDGDVDGGGGGGDSGAQRNSGGGGGSERRNGGGDEESHTEHHHGNGGRGPNGDVLGASGAKGENDGDSSSSNSDGAASVATAAAAATAVAVAVADAADVATASTTPSPPRMGANGSRGGSPTRPTPEV